MNAFITVCEPPEKRAAHCTGGKERHLTEAAVMIARGSMIEGMPAVLPEPAAVKEPLPRLAEAMA